MKYTPKKVFILENTDYVEITYEELCQREAIEPSYADKLFISLHGILMEVDNEFYNDFYKSKRRQDYITARAIAKGDVSYDALNTDEFNGEDVLIDPDENIPEQIAAKTMIEKLHRVLAYLPSDEEKLIREHFFEGISQVKLSELYGIDQSNISRKIKKILRKLKVFLES